MITGSKAPIAESILSYGLEDTNDLCHLGTMIDIGETIYNDLVTMLMTKLRQKFLPNVIGKKKTQTVTKPKPKSQRPDVSGVLPQKGKKSKD
ncbi:hypothetical protein Tco_0171403 [Tanacetum coccineum]